MRRPRTVWTEGEAVCRPGTLGRAETWEKPAPSTAWKGKAILAGLAPGTGHTQRVRGSTDRGGLCF